MKTSGQLADIVFQLQAAGIRGVLCEDAVPRAASNVTSLSVPNFDKVVERVVRGIGDQNFLSGLKYFFDSGPIVADDRNTTRCCFEQPDTWRIAGFHHLTAGNVQCE